MVAPLFWGTGIESYWGWKKALLWPFHFEMSSDSQVLLGRQEITVTEIRIVVVEVGNNETQVCSSGLVI